MSNYESMTYIKERSERRETAKESESNLINRESSVPAPRTGKKLGQNRETNPISTSQKPGKRRDSSAKRQINLKDYKMRTAKDFKFTRIRLQNLFGEPKNRFAARKGTSYYKNRNNNSGYYSTIEKGEKSLAQGYISKKINSQIVCLDRSLQRPQRPIKASNVVLNSAIAQGQKIHQINILTRESDNTNAKEKDSPISVNKDTSMMTSALVNLNKSPNVEKSEELRYVEKQTAREDSEAKKVNETRSGYQSSLRNLLAKPKKSNINLASKKAVDRSILQMSLLEDFYGGKGANKVNQSWTHQTMGSFYKGKGKEVSKGRKEKVRESSPGPSNKGILKRKIRLAEYFNHK